MRYLQRRRKGRMLMPSTVLKESDIEMAVREAVKELAPEVQWIRYEISLDWSGDRAIYFRVMLSNEASREARLAKVTKRVESFLTEKLNLNESDLLSYFSYRSRAEHAALKDPAWSKR
jgi:hypothetical protein